MLKENVLLWFVAKSVGPGWTYITPEVSASPFTFLKEVNRITQTKLYIKIPFLAVGTEVCPFCSSKRLQRGTSDESTKEGKTYPNKLNQIQCL